MNTYYGYDKMRYKIIGGVVMCITKEYKCFKGKETEECCNQRVKEAVRGRTSWIVLFIGIGFMIFALVTKTSDNDIFVNQVSFASTITSIILSVVAIWMSISGERTTNEIRTKVASSVDDLKETTAQSQDLVVELNKTLLTQNKEQEKLNEKIESILNDIDIVKGTVSDFNGKLESITSPLPTEQNVKVDSKSNQIIENVLDCVKEQKFINILFQGMDFIYEREKTSVSQVAEYVETLEVQQRDAYLVAGMLYVFSKNGMVKNGKYAELRDKYVDSKE